jgi:hypothetical protein
VLCFNYFLPGRNLTIHEIDGEPLAGFKELLVDAELSSIVRWALTFKEIRLLAHFSVLQVMPDNKLNIPATLTKFSQTESVPEEEAVLPSALVSKLNGFGLILEHIISSFEVHRISICFCNF